MRMSQQPPRVRRILLLLLGLASLMFTGCEKNSLGVKYGSVQGYVLNAYTNRPIADVLMRVEHAGQRVATAYTDGDGSYLITDLKPGEAFTLTAEKHGYVASMPAPVSFTIINGETYQAPVFKMEATQNLVKGTLKGYPIDSVTGRPLAGFTVVKTTPVTQQKSKFFEFAQDFKETGWTGIDGGSHVFKITCENYVDFVYGQGGNATPIDITTTPFDMGVISVTPVMIAVSGTLRNLPGHVLDDGSTGDAIIWAEAAGKIVATGTASGNLTGNVVYTLPTIPVSASAVAIKCKLRGYDVITINPSVSIPKQLPGGVIANIDADFANIEPIRRDLRVIVRGTKPGSDPSTFSPGEVARVYIKQGGKEIVPYVDVVCKNYSAEAYFTGIHTGYAIDIIVVNLNRGYYVGNTSISKVVEDGDTALTVELILG